MHKSPEMERMSVVEGSYAVAHAVKTCRPDVISAYPITPQTHIVEYLSQFVADGELNSEYINVESEFSALSALVGASAAGARTYSATTSQGLALMNEVLFNASGMRLPIVMTIVNRSLSAPINIWNDHQDSISARDAGWIQLYVEDAQEAGDAIAQAYWVAENHDVLLPTMVCMDGFILSHTYEPVVLLEEEKTREFLPPYEPLHKLDPANPKAFGMFMGPEMYTEFRYMQELAMDAALPKIKEAAALFKKIYGRWRGDVVDEYHADADVLLIAMGSVVGTIKDVIDELREEGVSVGLLKVRAFRPFPKQEIREAIKRAKVVAVLDKDVSIGTREGALFSEIKAALYNTPTRVPVVGYILGLGGRDIPAARIRQIVADAERVMEEGIKQESTYIDVNEEAI
ncbi:MAG TPA: pyruvate ferredoxin oxidoreductase [Methermicoccus shengliensis]|uniref:Pyruvate synthase subunit PorA n=2 Tax=Methermicoccus shengliensis TaxID=660064 RepID=A0A832VXE6_9EURY|nr:pyruvate synthase subunit PorA [Methermicoccus shengliensis]KUK04702.1 MAG: 2-oxoacid:ferredoxin oxidoreductase, alpha subunit [Euryarchaeota archaeon 55_53]KUK30531.1 MAG: 2-oxoacid:ferredoxin oxidoreductase, alpha subunit [Methanosarcinales archeaon 56_1174]MDI3487438.1 pyruvate ferredoxin oxidoreductase alpha subunit [Methanosarcinales archaeon]MDN5295233.1 pyruvate ferredoxin oxidoreductase alpha subunit [Methanosarcinales archaeon]HIH69678.1 pyruvate ferredoxin oxidoreductase [Methermi